MSHVTNHQTLNLPLNRTSAEADELLHAAERALFDATTRLHEALALIDREGLDASPEALAPVRHWASMIRRGLDRLGPPVRSVSNLHELRLKA